MINVSLFNKNDCIFGFEVSGHSAESEEDFEGKLVCAAVSSASIMAANTITEIIGVKAQVQTEDGYLKITVSNSDKCNNVFEGLKLHLEQLKKQYPDRINIKWR